MKVGFILECQQDGPDEKVIRCLLKHCNPAIEAHFRPQGDKRVVMRDSGNVAKQLLADGCDHVVIVWDLHPAEWGDDLQSKKPVCLHSDREQIKASLATADVKADRVRMVAITFMLESWLLADKQAIASFLSKKVRREITAQQIGGHRPSSEKKPKDTLSKIFEQHDCQRYRDHTDAERIAQEIANVAVVIKSCPSFARFWEKATIP